MDDIKPFLHKHYLLYDEYELLDERCDRCNGQIEGRALTCESCNFWLHDSCAKQQLPPEISDPLNSEHTLDFYENYYNNHFMCSKCLRLSNHYGYSSSDRSFNLDVVCASSSTNWEVEEMDKRCKDVAGKVSWFYINDRPLSLVKYRKVRRYEYSCSWCKESLSNTTMSYIRLYGYAEHDGICLHEDCLTKIPNKINFHPYHPYHPLYIQLLFHVRCIACGFQFYGKTTVYSCGKCSFHIHILCSNLKPTLKHYNSHHHPLTYFRQCPFKCNICKVRENSNFKAFYRCVECDFNVHVECLVPSSVKHKYHRHTLTLTDLFIDQDGDAEHYCDICEQRRDLQNHVYCCKECTFIAHIECVLNMVDDTRVDHGTTSMLMQEETQENDEELGTNFLMQQLFHPHTLSLKPVTDIRNYRKLRCKACCWEICEEDHGQVYVCEEGSCNHCYHKTCAEMPIDLNLIHIHHHPLTLVWESSLDFICDGCRDCSIGFKYACFECSFKLDIKCAATALNASKTQNQLIIARTYDQQQTKLSHFSHHHELHLGYVRFNIYSWRCQVCWLLISGPAYICFPCYYYVHESCLVKLPSHIETQFHPMHTLYTYTMTLLGVKLCFACKAYILDFGYRCCQCNIYFHYSCTTSLRRSLTSKFHPHNLYLFRQIRRATKWCHECKEPCESFYYCIECCIAYHLRCIPVPDKVKCKHHIHNLILKDRFEEDDLGEYYCDICEKERHRAHQVYFCLECDGTFVAHIECALAEAEELLE